MAPTLRCRSDSAVSRSGSATAHLDSWLLTATSAYEHYVTAGYVYISAVVEEREVEGSAVLLKAALVIIPQLQTILIATSLDLTFKEPGLSSLFHRIGGSSTRSSPAHMLSCTRATVMPPLNIRPARVQDHDQMLPVLRRGKALYPEMSELPQASRPAEPYALTRMVEDQNEHNRVFVAHAEDGRLVGFMVVTADVQTAGIMDAFDLHPYDNFLPPEVYAQQYQDASDVVKERKLTALHQSRTAALARKAQTAFEEQDDGRQKHEGATRDTSTASPSASKSAGSDDDDEIQMSDVELEAAAEPLEDEIRDEMSILCMDPPEGGEVSVLAITLLCIDPEYEPQGVELLAHAFAAFPTKAYVLLTLPHTAREPPLLELMSRVPTKPGCSFPELLYLFTRHGLHADVKIRLARESDRSSVTHLLEGMTNQSEFLESFEQALTASCAVVAICSDQVIGLCTINPKVDLDQLSTHFHLGRAIRLTSHPEGSHAEVDMYCINPIFTHWHRMLLSAVHKLCKRTVLHYALPPGQQPPEMMKVLTQAAPRVLRRGPAAVEAAAAAEYALYMFGRSSAFRKRRVVNTQVVVVGGSECGLAVVEALLLHPRLCFTALTLLAPGIISVSGAVCHYSSSMLSRLGLEARVEVLDAEMIGLDREAKLLDLSDGTSLPYGYLVIATGLQDQTPNRFSALDPDVAATMLSADDLAADFTVGDANVMSSILVYGDTLGSYHALATLEAKGAGGKALFTASPADTPDPMVALMREVAEKMDHPVPHPSSGVLDGLACVGGDARAVATFNEGSDAMEERIVNLVVCCSPTGVSPPLFECLNGSSLVFDGRLVVDSAFATNDPSIYGGGTVAKLSRRFGKRVLFQHYNSLEVGALVAASLCRTLDGSPASGSRPPGDEASAPPTPPPLRLSAARVVAATLPGRLHFTFAGCGQAMAAPSLLPPPGGRCLATHSERAYYHINLTATGLVHSIVYLGRSMLHAPHVAALVGLHVSFLNDIVTRVENGELADLAAFLSEPWAQLLYHDCFPELCAGMVAAAAPVYAKLLAAESAGSEEKADEAVRSLVHQQLLGLIEGRCTELPMYHLTEA
ncbi:MAG: hypothetical protein WDW36_006075 [Sanguina aurantia]